MYIDLTLIKDNIASWEIATYYQLEIMKMAIQKF